MDLNKIFIGFCMALLLGSCQLASFSSRPGVIVNEYPKALHGTFRTIDKHDGLRDTHDIVINEKGAKMNDAMMNKIIDLSDTNTSLSHLGDFYYLNVRETDSAGHVFWYVYPFEFDEKHLYIYTLTLGKTQKKMGKYLESSGKKNGNYKMDNEAFKHYCEKHLKRKKALKLTRIKS